MKSEAAPPCIPISNPMEQSQTEAHIGLLPDFRNINPIN